MGKNRFASAGTVLLAVVVATVTAFPISRAAIAQPLEGQYADAVAVAVSADDASVAEGTANGSEGTAEVDQVSDSALSAYRTAAASVADSCASVEASAQASTAALSAASEADVQVEETVSALASAEVTEGSRTLADGVYEIASAAASNEVLDVVDGSMNAGANVTLWNGYQAARQRWTVTYLGYGLYSLRAIHSGQALDVVASGQTSGTNVTQWTWCNTENQKWVIQDAGDGTYRIVSRCNGLSLSSAGVTDGSNVRVTDYTGAADERWIFNPILSNGTKTLDDGVYEISSAGASSEVLDVVAGSTTAGANVTLWSNYQDPRQRWRVTYLGNGYYSLRAVHSDQALDVVASGKENGTDVTQWSWCATDNQQWIIEDAGGGTYRIASRVSALSLTAAGTGDGSNVYTDSYDGSADQRWVFTSATPTGIQTLADGVYEIGSAANANEVLDVVAGSYTAGANVTLWAGYHDKRQRWRVAYLGDGYYSLRAFHSDQALDVVASGWSRGTNVTQWTWCNTENQQWVIQDAGEGAYRIVSRCDGLSLAVAPGISDGSNVYVTGYSGAANERWVFTEAATVEDGNYSICCASNEDQRLDVVAGSIGEGANVTLWSDDGCAWQRWRVENVDGVWYKISAIHSGQVLDVVASGTTPGTNVTQWSYFGNDNQLWKILSHDDGTVSFISKCNGLALDVEGDSISSGSNVVVSAYSLSEIGQRFKLNAAQVASTKNYSFTLEQMESWQHVSSYATYSQVDGLYVLNPSTYSANDAQYYRFADLRGYTGMTADELNGYISGTSSGRSGVLSGCGQGVVDAAKRYNLNEVYLLCHALLESGWGTSALSSGTYYDGNGFWDGSTWVEFSGYAAGTYYNFFGIGAYDGSAFSSGIKAAIANGWNSPEAALAGGAQWITSNYVYASSFAQETLYEMRWDIDRSESIRARGWHQYATDLEWDTKIAKMMSNCYHQSLSSSLKVSYIVPQYQG